MNFPYLTEFLTIIVIHFLAVASPGPDFAVVLKQSLIYGKRTGIWTSIGVGLGISIHVIYSLFGIGLIISQSILAFTILKFVGAGYLIYIGIKSLKEQPAKAMQAFAEDKAHIPSAMQSFKLGFLTNALNPKATLFFLSLFSVVISHETPLMVQAGYGIWMVVATGVWFCLISLFFASNRVRSFFQSFGHWVSRITGGALIALGVKLALTKAH